MTAHLVTGAMLISLTLAVPVHAQTSAPTLPKTDTPQSESTGPQDPRSTGSTTRSTEPLRAPNKTRIGALGGV